MFTRENPSPRYRQLQTLYRQMHRDGDRTYGASAQDTFPGTSLMAHLKPIKRLIERTGACTVLDYGSGKGQQYAVRPLEVQGEGKWQGVADYWEIAAVYCYDPNFEPFSRLPSVRYDGVVCTDVLEHCPEEDLPWVLGEIFGFASRFVYANIACFPARKRLPNGENAHCTVHPPLWWCALIERAAADHGALLWEFALVVPDPRAAQPATIVQRFANWRDGDRQPTRA
jgi:hypothetical protein